VKAKPKANGDAALSRAMLPKVRRRPQRSLDTRSFPPNELGCEGITARFPHMKSSPTNAHMSAVERMPAGAEAFRVFVCADSIAGRGCFRKSNTPRPDRSRPYVCREVAHINSFGRTPLEAA
jgi:hypothetical protein